ncbi:MAG TPA: mechanosensitive ion channel domain-containing protein [Gammaproteobacteria bacterium]|nr:mechanosensitive ion channel domain-containing protein [Gammaproteobacteria bacterium]
MEILGMSLQSVLDRLSAYANLETAFQLAIVVFAAVAGGIAYRFADKSLARRLETKGRGMLREVTLHSASRLMFPLVALLIVFAASMTLRIAGYNADLLAIAAKLLVALAVIRMLVYVLRVGFANSPALKAWEKVIVTSVWAVVAMNLVGWLQPVLDAMEKLSINVGDSHISLLMVVKLIWLSVLYLVLAFWVSGLLEQRLRVMRNVNASMRVGLTKVVKFSLVTLAILMALTEAGLNLASLTVFGGALGVGIGFGLQKIVSNFISGFILLGDRSIRPGDVITVGGTYGWVKELRARYIVVRNRDGVETLIPNENLVTTDVINWSFTDRQVRVRIPVQVSYGDDPEQAMEIVLNAARVNARVLADPVPVVNLMEFADSGILLELRVWLSDPENGIGSVRSDINRAIWKGFKEAGITIPFPQRDVHLRYVDGPAHKTA